jgi:hypothetical protein
MGKGPCEGTFVSVEDFYRVFMHLRSTIGDALFGRYGGPSN